MARISADGEDQAHGAINIPTYLRVAHNNQPTAKIELDSSLRLSQQVLSSSEELTDHQNLPQHPEILVQGHNAIIPVPTELAVYEGGQAVVKPKETELLDSTLWDMNFWGQPLGEALELARVKANEMDLKQVAKDIEAWIEKHPWKASFYAASALGFFAPQIFSIPALEALGFGAAGVRAGKFNEIAVHGVTY